MGAPPATAPFTVGDFRDVVLRTPGVDLGRVDVLPAVRPAADHCCRRKSTTNVAGAVTVMVVPRADLQIGAGAAGHRPLADVLEAVCAWLDPRRLITTQVFVRGASWVQVVVAVGIALMPGEVREEVEQRVRGALTAYLSPLTGGLGDGSSTNGTLSGLAVEAAGLSPTGWPLGMSVQRRRPRRRRHPRRRRALRVRACASPCAAVA